MRKPALLLASSLLLASCATTRPATSDGATAPQGSNRDFRVPTVMATTGVESIIGETPDYLGKRFGNPRIDLAEGDARKLQFASDECVLDIYFYPLRQGGEQVATHIEARQKQGGGTFDRGACIAAVERRR